MKNTIAIFGLSAALFATPAMAYQFELGGGFVSGELDDGVFSDDYDGVEFHAAGYFKPVDDSSGPKQQATFLQRASGIEVYTGKAELDESGSEIAFRGLDLSGVLENGTVLAVELSKVEVDDVDTDARNFGVGYYVAENATLFAYYIKLDGKNKDGLGFRYHQVFLTGSEHSVALGFDYNEGLGTDTAEDFKAFDGEIIYYPNANLAIGLGYGWSDISDVQTTTQSLQLGWFVNEALEVEVVYSRSEDDADSALVTELEDTSLLVGASYRF